MKLQLLILTQPKRRKMLEQLLLQIESQIDRAQARREVEVLIHEDEFGRMSDLGEKRECLRRQATAEYIAFCDDDDFVSPDYISLILPRLDGVDQIGFEIKCWENETALPTAYHSLKYGGWTHEADKVTGRPSKLLRDISHVCPMRRELALQRPMSGGFGEDRRWADSMRGLVKTETYIPLPLYYYLSRIPKRDETDWALPFRTRLLESLR